MRYEPTYRVSSVRRFMWSAAVWGIALLISAGLPATVSAQLNQTQHADGWILAAAHAPGYFESIWRTDLWVRSDAGGTITLYFCESSQDNTNAEGFDVDFESGTETVYIEDVVDHFLGIGDGGWTGAIHYESSSFVQVYARVYSISADGTESYGQLIEGIPTPDMSLPFGSPDYPGTREDQWMFALKHTADGRYRVNIGMVNPTGVACQFFVRIFDETTNDPDGASTIHLDVLPFSMVQLSDPFADVSGGEWDSYTVRVECADDGAGAFGYASVVDNATNDAYFVRGVKRMTPDAD